MVNPTRAKEGCSIVLVGHSIKDDADPLFEALEKVGGPPCQFIEYINMEIMFAWKEREKGKYP